MSRAVVHVGDVRAILPTLEAGSVRCCVTSPPYWGLRDYGVAGQLGLEPTPDAYVANLVAVFRAVRRVLADDGTLWLNLGDSYAANRSYQVVDSKHVDVGNHSPSTIPDGLKPKDLVGIPWRVAFALQADGWYLRSDIIWAKPNPMPESVTDRPTKAHEYLFLLAKSERYYYDAAAIAEDAIHAGRLVLASGGDAKNAQGANRAAAGFTKHNTTIGATRNARTVWTISTQPYPDAHFATFPEDLPRRCILAGSALGDTILDPFAGSGTTLAVAIGNGRHGVGIELNPAYAEMARSRIGPMFCTVAA
jgi:DNA modification methylase